MDAFTRANLLHIDEEYDAAAALYDEAIALDPKSEVYIARATNQIKRNQFENALLDAQQALTQQPENASAHFRAGQALFYLKKYMESQCEFEIAGKLGKDVGSWLVKCKRELDVMEVEKKNIQRDAVVATSVNAVVNEASETARDLSIASKIRFEANFT